ncbi:GIY-YIG nuclease family protein [Rhodonellum sp.]|uniref:GIY-YIG nuclease family protein n=1 Tax=Rhodonellum sp. TaxID=2231180 RepID=UPI00351E3FF0
MGHFFLYILFSTQLDRFYTGVTTLAVQERIENHINKKYGKLNFTQKANDWVLHHYIQCEDFSQARKIEIHIKKMKSKIYIINLKKYPEIQAKFLLKHKSN